MIFYFSDQRISVFSYAFFCPLFFSGGRRVTTTRANLPTKLVIKPVFPVKTAVHKLTLDTNRPPASLNDLFPGIVLTSPLIAVWSVV